MLAKPWSAVLCTAFCVIVALTGVNERRDGISVSVVMRMVLTITPEGGAEHRTPRLRKQKSSTFYLNFQNIFS